jgi:hypothetical protein
VVAEGASAIPENTETLPPGLPKVAQTARQTAREIDGDNIQVAVIVEIADSHRGGEISPVDRACGCDEGTVALAKKNGQNCRWSWRGEVRDAVQ